MQLPDFTVEHLKALPLRAIVAFAARCARRVEPLAQLPEGRPAAGEPPGGRRGRPPDGRGVRQGRGRAPRRVGGRGDRREPRRRGRPRRQRGRRGRRRRGGPRGGGRLASSSAPARPSKSAPGELKTAEARKFLGALTHVTADLAALAAFTAAVEAFAAVGYHNEDFVNAALNDYDRLLRLKLGRYPEPGEPIDPSPGGPLGRL